MVRLTTDRKSEKRIVRCGDWREMDGADDVFWAVWSLRAVRELY